MFLAECTEGHRKITLNINDLSYIVRGAIFEVYTQLGPGLLESVYEAALVYEIRERGLEARTQINIPVEYKNIKLDVGFRMDILVENQLVVEIKSIEDLQDVHKKQLLTYLKLANKPLGLLVNFNAEKLKDKRDIIRIINSK